MLIKIACHFLVFPNSYFEKLKLFNDGCHEDKSGCRKSVAFDLALNWFHRFVRNAESLPNTSTRQLPSCLTKGAVYTLYREELGDKPYIAQSTFLYNLWRKEFPDVIIPKASKVKEPLLRGHLSITDSSPWSRQNAYIAYEPSLTQTTDTKSRSQRANSYKRNLFITDTSVITVHIQYNFLFVVTDQS